MASKRLVPLWIALALLILAFLLSFTMGRYSVSLRELLGILTSKLCDWEPFWSEQAATVVTRIRGPRLVTAVLVGASLSAAGGAYQGVFQNPMASPDVLGASSGAAFGAALAILLGHGGRVISLWAFFSSLFTVGLVWFISLKAQGKQVLTLVLTGMMVSSLFTAGTSYIKLVADPTNQLPEITYWLLGSIAGVRQQEIGAVLPIMAVGLVLLLILRWRLNLLTLGEEQASTMGIAVGRVRLGILVSATLLTASSIAVSGQIGWVGLIIPNLCRRLVGSDYRVLTPMSMVTGGLFMLLVDNVSRTLFPVEVPLGILTAFLGAPFFLYLLLRKGGLS